MGSWTTQKKQEDSRLSFKKNYWRTDSLNLHVYLISWSNNRLIEQNIGKIDFFTLVFVTEQIHALIIFLGT